MFFFSLGVYYSSLFKHSSVSIFPLISILLINFFQDCSAFQNSFSNCNQTQQIFTLSFLIGFLLLYLCYLRSFLFFMFQCLQDFITLVYIYFSSFFQIHIRYSFWLDFLSLFLTAIFISFGYIYDVSFSPQFTYFHPLKFFKLRLFLCILQVYSHFAFVPCNRF